MESAGSAIRRRKLTFWIPRPYKPLFFYSFTSEAAGLFSHFQKTCVCVCDTFQVNRSADQKQISFLFK